MRQGRGPSAIRRTALFGKLGVRERKKMIELPRLEAADAKIHE